MYVGNLPNDIKEKELQELFDKARAAAVGLHCLAHPFLVFADEDCMILFGRSLGAFEPLISRFHHVHRRLPSLSTTIPGETDLVKQQSQHACSRLIRFEMPTEMQRRRRRLGTAMISTEALCGWSWPGAATREHHPGVLPAELEQPVSAC